MIRRKLTAAVSLLAIALLLATGLPTPLSATPPDDASPALTMSSSPEAPDVSNDIDTAMQGTVWRAERPWAFAQKASLARGTRFRAKAAGYEWVHFPVPLIRKMYVPRLVSAVRFCARSSNGSATKPVELHLWEDTTQFTTLWPQWSPNNAEQCMTAPAGGTGTGWREALGVSLLLYFANSADTITLSEVGVVTKEMLGPTTDTEVAMQGTAWRPEVPGHLYPIETYAWGTRLRRKSGGLEWVHLPLPLLTRWGDSGRYISLVQFCGQSSNGASTKPVRVDLWANSIRIASQSIAWPADNGYHCVDVPFNPPVLREALGVSVLVNFANSTDSMTLNKAWVRLTTTGASSADQPLAPEAVGQTHSATQGTAWQAQNPLLFSRFRALGWGVETQKKAAGQTWVNIPIQLLRTGGILSFRISKVQFCAQSTNGLYTKPLRIALWSGDSQFYSQFFAWPANNNYNCFSANFDPYTTVTRDALGVSVLLNFANSADRITLYKAWAEVVTDFWQ